MSHAHAHAHSYLAGLPGVQCVHDLNIYHTTIQVEQSDLHGLCHTEDGGGHGHCWPGKTSENRLSSHRH